MKTDEESKSFFISEHYVERMVDDMRLDQERNMEKIQNLLDSLSDKTNIIEEIRKKELPEIKESLEFCRVRISRVIETQSRNFNREKQLKKLSKCWKILTDNMRQNREATVKFNKMLSHFKRY